MGVINRNFGCVSPGVMLNARIECSMRKTNEDNAPYKFQMLEFGIMNRPYDESEPSVVFVIDNTAVTLSLRALEDMVAAFGQIA